MSLKFGIIGCGRISPNHIQAAENNKIKTIAICDIVEEKMLRLSSKYDSLQNSKKYTLYKEMILNEKLDIVSICTESGNHAQIALDCIDAGINIIIEKPIALSLDDADEIIRHAEKKNVKVCACHQNRFNKSIQKIRDAYESGLFGRLLYGTAHVRWNRNEDYYKQATWRGSWANDGGSLMNQCIHNIDLLRWMMGGEIEEVVAMTDRLNHPYIEAEDFGAALIKFSNGAYGIIEGTTVIYPRNLEETLYIFGTEGTVKAGGKSVNLIEAWEFENSEETLEDVKIKYSENPPTVYGFGHTPLFADFIDAIISDRKPYVDAVEGRKALEIILAIYESAYTNSPVKLPLNGIKSIDYKGRFDK